MYGVNGSWIHIQQRGLARLPIQHRAVAARMLGTLLSRAKDKKLPNYKWYRPIIVNKETIGYICGQGCHLSTILEGHMRPQGQRI